MHQAVDVYAIVFSLKSSTKKQFLYVYPMRIHGPRFFRCMCIEFLVSSWTKYACIFPVGMAIRESTLAFLSLEPWNPRAISCIFLQSDPSKAAFFSRKAHVCRSALVIRTTAFLAKRTHFSTVCWGGVKIRER